MSIMWYRHTWWDKRHGRKEYFYSQAQCQLYDEKCGIYAISCAKCSIVTYIGETERQLKERMSEHLRDIRLRHEKPISSHFDESHSENDLRFSVLEVIRRDSKIERQLRESIWIRKLKTEKPYGCNNKEVAVHPTVYNLRWHRSFFARKFIERSSAFHYDAADDT